ncbi:MAG: metallophosphoesterase family protein [Anaerolineales bacterium]|jgi:predicted phosphodiesterase
MRVALFSDIHGNISGLKAVLAHIDELGGADILYAAGDLITGGPGGEDLLDLLIERQVHMLRGNMEEVVTDLQGSLPRVAEPWKEWAKGTVAWLEERLSPPYWDLLRSLPLSETVTLAPGKRLLVCHATPRNPWEMVCAADAPLEDLEEAFGNAEAEIIAYGHYHRHHVMQLGSKLLLNVASVGSWNDDFSAWTLLEYSASRLVIQQYQVPYDTQEETRLRAQRGVP